VVGDVLDPRVTRTVWVDEPAVALERQGEDRQECGDLLVVPHLVVRADRVRPGELKNLLAVVGKTGSSQIMV
jgi:hypothetical protein